MRKLNVPEFEFRIKQQGLKKYIFDEIRKKYIYLTEEEWVRQNFIKYLIQNLQYPKNLISVEKQLELNNTVKRTDIVAYGRDGKPKLIVECKSPAIKISQEVFD